MPEAVARYAAGDMSVTDEGGHEAIETQVRYDAIEKADEDKATGE